jgi:hypothetical protein
MHLKVRAFRLGPDPRIALWPAAKQAAQTGRTHNRTRPMLQQRQKVLANAPSTRDPNRPIREADIGVDPYYPWLTLDADHEAAKIHRPFAG